MISSRCSKTFGTGATFFVLVIVGMLITAPRGHADDDDDFRIQEGLEIAPVPLNLDGKDRDLVGLGSYIVNAQAVCNDCHSRFPLNGAPTANTPAANPYLLPPPFG